MRQRGEDVFFLTGTDEHGEPVALAAERAGKTPQALADENAERFREMTERIDVTNDFFIRTSDPQHVAEVQRVMQRVYDNGFIYEGTWEGWYCPRCADYKSEHEMGPDNTCEIHKIALDREHERSWFFKLSAFAEQLEQLYGDRRDFVQPTHRYNEALSFIRGGLQDVAISRAKITWGVPLPWKPDEVMYVWFDALLNYYSALSYAQPGTDLHEKFWPPTVHVMAKDILKFHAVYWPALLMAAEIELPRRMFVHGYLLMDGEKMSKSLGNVLDPNKVIDLYGSDALRFYCFREVGFGQDGSISTEGFETRYNTELANEYGNLASRSLAMITRFRGGVVPTRCAATGVENDFSELRQQVQTQIDELELSGALETIWVRVRRLNQFVEEQAPWKLAKDETASAQLDSTLYALAEGMRVISILLQPYVPQSAAKLLAALGVSEEHTTLASAAFGDGPGGQTITELEPLFPKFEAEEPA